MLAGKAYQAGDAELSKERLKAREIVFEFNNLAPKFIKQRKELIKRLFGKTEKMFYIEPPFRCDYGYNIEIGDNFYANFNLVILDCAKVSIGNSVFIAPATNATCLPRHSASNLDRLSSLDFAVSASTMRKHPVSQQQSQVVRYSFTLRRNRMPKQASKQYEC